MSDLLFNVENKIVLITGSSQGIGYAFAQGFVERGAHVILNGRNTQKLQQAENAINNKNLKGIVSIRSFDVGCEQSVIENIAEIERNIGPIDILINNAGIQKRVAFTECPLETWQTVMNINVNAAFMVAREVTRFMKERKSGKVINICSLLSDFGRSSIVPYTAAKGAIKMMTKGMATELAQHNIQVNGIAPGYFSTDMNTTLVKDKKFSNWLENRTPAHRWGEVEELLGACVMLASPASDFIQGQIIFVDGGISASL